MKRKMFCAIFVVTMLACWIVLPVADRNIVCAADKVTKWRCQDSKKGPMAGSS
jgi:hypothetical protein